MTSVSGNLRDANKRQYISSAQFQNHIFTYSTYMDSSFNTRGRLAINTSATAQNCTAGHILRENGRKLIDGVNPDLVDPTNGYKYTYLVGVIDAATMISGFIDPNSPMFAPFNGDKPAFLNDTGVETKSGYTNLQDEGAPVYTRGDITTLNGDMLATIGNITAAAGNISATVGNVSAGSNVSAGINVTAGSNITASNGNIVATVGSISAGSNMSATNNMTAKKYFVTPIGSGTGTSGSPLQVSAGTANLNGGTPSSQTIYTTAATAGSLIFVTVNNVGPRATSVVPSAGSFVVYSSVNGDASTFYWMIVN